MIPRFAPTFSYADLFTSLDKGFQETGLEKLRFSLSTMCNAKYVFFLESARVALYVLLQAYNRPGGVLLPAYNCIVVPEAIKFAGYTPVFVDVDYTSLNITAETIKKHISADISVVLATHLFGIPCDVAEIKNVLKPFDILLVEDAAPALGAELHGQVVGSFGEATIVSFQSTKVISGEAGGVLMTNNAELAAKVEKILSTVSISRGQLGIFVKAFARKMVTTPWLYSFAQTAYGLLRNEEMYEIVKPKNVIPEDYLQACPGFSSALILAQLNKLDWNLSRRRKIAQIYRENLIDIPGLSLPDIPVDCAPAWIQFPIQVEDKKAFYRFMQRNHVDLTWTYRYSCADSYGFDNFPNTQTAAKTVLGLPTYPSLSDEQANLICNIAQKYPAERH